METAFLTDPLCDRFIGCDFCTEASSGCRLLPCLHVVCKNCLDDSQQLTADEDDSLNCPVCGQEYIDKKKKTKTKKTKTSNAAEADDSSDHRSQSQGRSDPTAGNSDDDREAKAMEKPSSCGGCQQILCVACLASDGLGIIDSVKASREAVEQVASDVTASKATALKKLESIDAERQEFLSRAEHLRCDVNRAREQLKGIVDRHADSLLSELSTWEEETVRATKVDIDSLCRYVSCLDKHKTSCVEALAKGSAKDFDSIGRDHLLLQMPPLKFEGQMNTLHVNLEQTKLNDLLIAYNDNIIGILKDEELPEFEEKEKRSEELLFNDQTHFARLRHLHQTPKKSDSKGCIEFREDPVLIRTLKTQPAAKENRGILGATVLDDELYAVTKDSSEVEVFDLNRLIFSCELEVGDLFNPEDIASCSVLKCLYIMDCKTSRSTNKILRTDLNGKLIRKWSTEEDWGHISVSPKTNLLLSVYSRNRLKEYSPLGYLVRVLDLSSFDHIRHAIQLTSGHYLVSHGETGDSVHRVAKVDSNGNTVKAFTSEALHHALRSPMKRPFYLETVDDDGASYVLVADADNGRVLLVNSRLELERELLSSDRHGLRYPVRICLDRKRARLFVVDNQVANKRICVFDVR